MTSDVTEDTILTGRAEVKEWFSLRNNSTKNNMGIELI